MWREGTFEDHQRRLATYCRTNQRELIGEGHIPQANPERLSVYRRLVFNGVFDNLSRAYPIAAATLGEKQWAELVEEFFAKHECPHPQLWRMPAELVAFVKSQRIGKKLERPYLDDLLRFEWAEIEVHMMEDVSHGIFGKQELNLGINPYHRILTFDYPVFRMRGDELLQHRSLYHLLVFRHLERCTVHFIELSSEFAQLFERWGRAGKVNLRKEKPLSFEFIEALGKEGVLYRL